MGNLKPRLSRLISAVLFVCIILAVGLTVYIASTPPVGERFTEFYILGPSGKAYGYPTNLTLGESGTVIIGVFNREYEDVFYKVVVSLENETIGAMGNIILGHEKGWEGNFTFMPEKVGERMRLEFLLYRDDSDETYRSLHLWITVRPRE